MTESFEMGLGYRRAVAAARADFDHDRYPFEALDPRGKFLRARRGNITSQHGEDGVLAALFERIGLKHRFCFEVGAYDGLYLSNTKALRDDGWSALLIECDPFRLKGLRQHESPAVTVLEEKIGPASLDRLLRAHGAATDLDLGIIDIDGDDAQVWEGLLHFRPRVALVEFNTGGDGELGGCPGVWQAGMSTIVNIGLAKAYVPLATIGCNVLFVEGSEAKKL